MEIQIRVMEAGLILDSWDLTRGEKRRRGCNAHLDIEERREDGDARPREEMEKAWVQGTEKKWRRRGCNAHTNQI